MKYGEYKAQVFYDAKAKIFHGEVTGIKGIITFQGANAQELEKAFKDSVDDYLAWRKELGEDSESVDL